LKPGDKIGVISPSEPATKKDYEKARRVIEKMGFEVVLGKNTFNVYNNYMAGTDKERVFDINQMFKNPEIRGILCSCGGYNSNRLLDLIDYDLIKKNPKIFMGFSDITVLLNAIYKKTGLITFHGHNFEGFAGGLSGKNEYTKEYFEKAVMRKDPIGKITPRGDIEVIRSGKASGKLVGGNLSVLKTLIGTEYEPEWEGKILFWEDFKQTPEDIDHDLTHLRLNGAFDKISGMVIGVLIKCKFPPFSYIKNKNVSSIGKIILEISKDYSFPIIFGVPFGHIDRQIVLPVGAKASINTRLSIPFSIDSSAVK
jgi:muramoyltetrapeptide carboxypeptidase